MTEIVAIHPGFLTTVQDLGRAGFTAQGISASGAADPLALRIGNRLVGNDDGAAALEMTVVGGSFGFEGSGFAVLAGGDAAAVLEGTPRPPWRAFPFRSGDTIACGPMHGGSRAYLCVRGGIAVPSWLGSASTHLVSGLGGFHGRALAAGDRVPVGREPKNPVLEVAVDPSAIPGYRASDPFRVMAGPQSAWFPSSARAALFDDSWRVSDACDRMGIGLSGPKLAMREPRELLTEGVCCGAIQVPPSGAPIVLFVEHQTTGGYPKIANVIAADLPRLGTLRPRDVLRFAPVAWAEAHELLRSQEEALDALFA